MREPADREVDKAALEELARAFAADPIDQDGLSDDLELESSLDDEIVRAFEAVEADLFVESEMLGGAVESSHGPATATHIIGFDDEFVDPIYLAGNLQPAGTRGVLFIEDDNKDDPIEAWSDRDRSRGIEPRLRERLIAVRRAKGRKRLKWAVLIGLGVVLVVGSLAVLGSPLFAIRSDQTYISGNVYTDPLVLQEIVDDLVGTPVLVVNEEAAEDRLEAIPWVHEALVRAEFPHGLRIEIRERQAMTTFQGPDGRYRVLDREGRVLAVLEDWPIAYILLGGPDPVDLQPGEFAPTGYAAASELAKNLTGSIRGQVEFISVKRDGSNLVIMLKGGTEIRFGEARDLFTKLVRLETVFASPDRYHSRVIDVSTKEVTLQ